MEMTNDPDNSQSFQLGYAISLLNSGEYKVSAVICSVRLIANISLAKQSLLGAYISDKPPVLVERGT